jgi:hypothetical protein
LIILGIQLMKLLIMQFSPTSYYFIRLWSKKTGLRATEIKCMRQETRCTLECGITDTITRLRTKNITRTDNIMKCRTNWIQYVEKKEKETTGRVGVFVSL